MMEMMIVMVVVVINDNDGDLPFAIDNNNQIH